MPEAYRDAVLARDMAPRDDREVAERLVDRDWFSAVAPGASRRAPTSALGVASFLPSRFANDAASRR